MLSGGSVPAAGGGPASPGSCAAQGLMSSYGPGRSPPLSLSFSCIFLALDRPDQRTSRSMLSPLGQFGDGRLPVSPVTLCAGSTAAGNGRLAGSGFHVRRPPGERLGPGGQRTG